MLRKDIERMIEKSYHEFRSWIKRPKEAVLTFSVLISKEEDILVGHCLELDIVTTAETSDSLVKDMMDLIDAQIVYAFGNDNIENLYHPAPTEAWEEFFECKKFNEKTHKIKKEDSADSLLPTYIIAKTCLSQRPCHV